MFWNDPNLYGFAYKDINTPVQTPFMGLPNFPPVQNPFLGTVPPWQNIPRFLPPTYGFVPPYLHTQGFTPYMQPFNMNLPFYNTYRPFIY